VRGGYSADGASAVSTGVDTPDRATATGAPACADCAVEARVQPGSALEAGVFVRGAASTSDRYDAIVLPDGRLQLRRLNAGKPALLGELAGAVTSRTAFTLVTLSATGSGPVALTVSLEGVPRLSATDTSASAITGPGNGGLWTYTAGVRFDDFAVRTVP
jgi:hypothetical protein